MAQLDLAQARVLGSLMEKQLATPQYYPLTLNALVLACNQSSNREPVMALTEDDVTRATDGLKEHGLVRLVHSPGGRAPKYRHVVDEVWGLDDMHRALLAVLLLRGPQTSGELRGRTERLASFGGVGDVEEVLGLLGRRDVPLVERLERQPGQKEARYAQLLSDQPGAVARPVMAASLPALATEPAPAGLSDRVAALEARVDRLEAALSGMPGTGEELG